jgi:hypothetical protein
MHPRCRAGRSPAYGIPDNLFFCFKKKYWSFAITRAAGKASVILGLLPGPYVKDQAGLFSWLSFVPGNLNVRTPEENKFHLPEDFSSAGNYQGTG